jgi:hypothetical protein
VARSVEKHGVHHLYFHGPCSTAMLTYRRVGPTSIMMCEVFEVENHHKDR